jgi:hypothetical protein
MNSALKALSAVSLGLLLPCGVAHAQTPETTPELTALSYEATLPFTSIGFAGIPAIPPNVAQAIQAGALEIRQSVQYAPNSKTLRVRHFLVAPGAPNPTPSTAAYTPVEDYLVAVRNIEHFASPHSLLLSGTTDRVAVTSPFGPLRSNPLLLSLGYMPADEDEQGHTAFNNITLVLPGRMTTYIRNVQGILSFESEGNGGGPAAGGPVADAGSDIVSAQSEITLDGSRSSAPEGETLEYEWRVVRGAAGLVNANTAMPRVQLTSNFGEYLFELTVTDSKGRTSTDAVTVTYTGRY